MINKVNLLDTVFSRIESIRTLLLTTILLKTIFMTLCKILKVKDIVKIFYRLLSLKIKKNISKKILNKLWKCYRMAINKNKCNNNITTKKHKHPKTIQVLKN